MVEFYTFNDILKEIIAKKKDQNFDISLSINFTEGINKIKIVGDNFSGNFKIIQNEKIKFKLAKDFKNDFGDNFPFNKNWHKLFNRHPSI